MNNSKKIESIDVQKLCHDNELEIVNLEHVKVWNNIQRPAINRVGLELMGNFYNEGLDKNIIGWGTTESAFMDSMDEKQLSKNINEIFKHNPPLVICSSGVSLRNKEIILKEANKIGIPVVFSKTKLSFLITTVGIYIAEHFSPSTFIHGSLIIINGIGVMVIGDSGIGKSEAVLELIQRGHMFVSDDSIVIKRIGNKFIGSSPEITKNVLEARGLGLIDIKAIYGDKSVKDKTDINLVVELKHDNGNHFDRLGNENHYFEILGGKISKIIIPIRLGRNVASLIEAAASLIISKNNGIDALKIIQERMVKDGDS